jgi:serine/threonine protein phosphatase 1
MALRWRSKPPRIVSRIPTGERVYAIGDIHGRLDLLEELLASIAADDDRRPAALTHLIFLGDLIDRGPASAAVVDHVMQLSCAQPRVRVLMGNHEEVFVHCLDGNVQALRLFLKIGGAETILSYGVASEDLANSTFEELSEILLPKVPQAHREFLGALENRIEIGDYLFVHAGIRPATPVEEQQPTDLRWIREPFLNSTVDHGRVVVHGHTITKMPVTHTNRIGIDTGAYESGRLTAIGLENTDRWFLSTGGVECGEC